MASVAQVHRPKSAASDPGNPTTTSRTHQIAGTFKVTLD